MAYFTEAPTLAKCNFDIYDNKFIVNIKLLAESRPEVVGVSQKLPLPKYYKNLDHCLTKVILKQSQTWCEEFLCQLNYDNVDEPRKLHGKANQLTRRPGDQTKGGDKRLKMTKPVDLEPEHLAEQSQMLANIIV